MPYAGSPEERGLRNLVALVYSIFIALFWIPAFVSRRFLRFIGEIGTESWPRTIGSITSVNVRVVHGWIVDYALGELNYSYRVRSDYYSGHFTRQCADEQAAWSFVDSVDGKPVTLRYRDDNYQSSVLRDADQDPMWLELPSPVMAQIRMHWSDQASGEPGTGDDQTSKIGDRDDCIDPDPCDKQERSSR